MRDDRSHDVNRDAFRGSEPWMIDVVNTKIDVEIRVYKHLIWVQNTVIEEISDF